MEAGTKMTQSKFQSPRPCELEPNELFKFHIVRYGNALVGRNYAMNCRRSILVCLIYDEQNFFFCTLELMRK